jgi:DinB superfamily
MNETPAEYIARITNFVKGHEPVAVLERTPGKVSSLLAGKPASAVAARPAPGKWSAAEIVIHLSETELVIGYRLRLVLGASGTPIQAFDQDAWAVRYASEPYEPALELFRTVRAANLSLLKSLTPEQWQHYGMHAERGKETVERIVQMNAGHDLNHLEQIARMFA